MVRVAAGSLQLTIAAMDTANVSASFAAMTAMERAAEVLESSIRDAMGLTDHSLSELAALDHPYAQRHGAIQTSKLGHDAHLVHKRTGRLVSSLGTRKDITSTGDAGFIVSVDANKAPEAEFVILGTRNMLPRDTLHVVAGDRAVQQRMTREVLRVLGKELRTKAVARVQTYKPASGKSV
jgi:hypothetical protein